MSIELLKDLHLLTREGQLNADARRKLKQIRHLVGLLKPALDDTLARQPSPSIVDCGAGKSYLGALLYELVIGPAGRGTLTAIEARPELSEQAAARAARFGQDRFRVETAAISGVTERANHVTALHACDTATDDALVLAIAQGADHVAVVPCCQAGGRTPARRRPSRKIRRPPRCSSTLCTAAKVRLAPHECDPRARPRGARLQGHHHRARRLGAPRRRTS